MKPMLLDSGQDVTCIYVKRFALEGESFNDFKGSDLKSFLLNITYIFGRCVESELEKYW